MRSICVVFLLVIGLAIARPGHHHQDDIPKREIEDDINDKQMHPTLHLAKKKLKNNHDGWSKSETETNYWYHEAQVALKKQLEKKLNTDVAKNVIFFMGDGLSIPTLVAARIYQGQLAGKSGEEDQLYWETFPFTGLSKTWCIDKQVPDSACTSTAYMTGVKSKYGTVGMNGKVIRGVCKTQNNTKNHVDSYLKWAQDQDKSIGIVTTTRVTHASPAGGYAHAADRNWESDSDVLEGKADPEECLDIADQLINRDPGKDFKVILGGGRRVFLPNDVYDEEHRHGTRSDGRNLIEEWKADKENRGSRYLYSWNRTSLLEAMEHPQDYEFLLGLYSSTHMPYHREADLKNKPTLSEMTEAAVKVLSQNENGFVLFVEGGRIDHAHHETYATLALDETVELAKAVKTGREITSAHDTLVIVTADHAHTMSVAGYSDRGTQIVGLNDIIGSDKLGYTTLSYANGPGYRPGKSGDRHDVSQDNITDIRYQFPSMVPLNVESHGGDDVAIFASGPWSHLFTGTIQQSNIPHFLAYASCVSPQSACDDL